MPVENAIRPLDHHFARLMARLDGGVSPFVREAAEAVSRAGGEGHTCLALADFWETKTWPETLTYKAWRDTLRQSPVVGAAGEFKPLILDARDRLYLRRYWEYEQALAENLHARFRQTPPVVDTAALRAGLQRFFPSAAPGDAQKLAAFAAVTRHCTVITGGPGTGKTRTVAVILALLQAQAPGKAWQIELCAPTGKAAARLQESLRKTALDLSLTPAETVAAEAKTIHRLLGRRPHSPYFRHDRENLLPADVVVVDEASMVDLALMAKLFEALPLTTRVILLGDKDQLASVEAGSVLGEICRHGEDAPLSPKLVADFSAVTGEVWPKETAADVAPLADGLVELKRNFRFGERSGIGRFSTAVKSGDVAGAIALLRTPVGDDLVWQPTPGASSLEAELRPVVEKHLGGVFTAQTLDAAMQGLGEFRLLAAVRNGPFGVEHLNRLVENILMRTDWIPGGAVWYRGRPVMVTENDYETGLFNGDTGVTWPDEDGTLRVFFPTAGGGWRRFAPARLPTHETAYALTVHKSQGSEFGRVLLLLPDRDNRVLTRELLYTGITRARHHATLWADEMICRPALARTVRRTSGFRETLWGTGL